MSTSIVDETDYTKSLQIYLEALFHYLGGKNNENP